MCAVLSLAVYGVIATVDANTLLAGLGEVTAGNIIIGWGIDDAPDGLTDSIILANLVSQPFSKEENKEDSLTHTKKNLQPQALLSLLHNNLATRLRLLAAEWHTPRPRPHTPPPLPALPPCPPAPRALSHPPPARLATPLPGGCRRVRRERRWLCWSAGRSG